MTRRFYMYLTAFDVVTTAFSTLHGALTDNYAKAAFALVGAALCAGAFWLAREEEEGE